MLLYAIVRKGKMPKYGIMAYMLDLRSYLGSNRNHDCRSRYIKFVFAFITKILHVGCKG